MMSGLSGLTIAQLVTQISVKVSILFMELVAFITINMSIG